MEAQVICPIWGKPVRRLLEDDSARAVAVYSPRAGGKYRLTSSAHAVLANLTPAQKVSITSWVVAQHKAGIPVPEITSYNLDAVKSRRRLSFSARVDAALELLAARRPTLDAEFVINPQANPDEEAELLMAVSETETTSELRRLLIIMKDMGILDANLTGHARFTISAGGWGRVDKLMERNESSPRAFIAMWFDASTTGAYEKAIFPAVEESGYIPIRIDRKEHINKIDDEIIAEIRRAHFVVADFTCEPGRVRGGVYFEAGLAMGLRIPVIWTCKDTSVMDLHFDTRQYSHLIWMDPVDLRQKLKARIGAILGTGPISPQLT